MWKWPFLQIKLTKDRYIIIGNFKIKLIVLKNESYCFKIHAKINGATMVASDSTIYLGVSISSLPQVIFSFGTAPEYDPYEVVESDIWQK